MRKTIPDFGTPNRYHIDPNVKPVIRKIMMNGSIGGRSAGEYGNGPHVAESGREDWTGIPYLDRCPIHFFHRDRIGYAKTDECNCKRNVT